MSDTSKFKIDKNQQPDPGKKTGGSGQVGKMKSNSQLKREAIQEDNGKI